MTEIEIAALLKEIESRLTSYEDLPWLSRYTDHGSFRPDGEPEITTNFEQIGKWLVVVIIFEWDGTTMDQTTDRLGGDPYYGVLRHDWIGLAETAPSSVKSIKEMNDWAVKSLKYVRENNDVGDWGLHEGAYFEAMNEDGTLVIRVQHGKYQDVDPMTIGELETIQLEDEVMTSKR